MRLYPISIAARMIANLSFLSILRLATLFLLLAHQDWADWLEQNRGFTDVRDLEGVVFDHYGLAELKLGPGAGHRLSIGAQQGKGLFQLPAYRICLGGWNDSFKTIAVRVHFLPLLSR
jgi:hypothetical protein